MQYAKIKNGVLTYAPEVYVSTSITINNFNKDPQLMQEFGYKQVIVDGFIGDEYITIDNIEETEKYILIHKVLDNSESVLNMLKSPLIEQTRLGLSNYLDNNPLLSSAKGGVEKEYTVSLDKQNQLTSTIADYISNVLPYIMQATSEGITGDSLLTYLDSLPIDIYWNSKGDVCEKWKYSEIFQLKNDMMSYVRPIVEYQRYLEKEITLCPDQEKLFKIDLTFSKERIEKSLVVIGLEDSSNESVTS